MAKNLEGGGLDTIFQQDLLAISPILKSELGVYIALTCEVGVWGPHNGKHLSNQTYSVLNRAGSYLESAGSEGSCPVMPSEGGEDSHRIPVQYE